jgi:threonine/homoserine/homoserine lactone efflux protein
MIAAFLLASLVLAITPGPAVVYLLTRTVAHGRRAGFASLAGVALGNFGNALGASIGLAALFAASAFAFTAVKLAGALYLVYLGIRALLPAPVGPLRLQPDVPSAGSVFRAGFLVALLNPKTAIFFAAFLPQFIDATAGSPMMQSVLLGGLFVVVAASTDAVYVLLASRLAPRPGAGHPTGAARPGKAAGGGEGAGAGAAAAGGPLAGFRRSGRYLTAASFIGLGAWTALTGQRTVR